MGRGVSWLMASMPWLASSASAKLLRSSWMLLPFVLVKGHEENQLRCYLLLREPSGMIIGRSKTERWGAHRSRRIAKGVIRSSGCRRELMVDGRSGCCVTGISVSSRRCLHAVDAKQVYDKVSIRMNIVFVMFNSPAEVLGMGIALPYEAIEEVLLVLARL